MRPGLFFLNQIFCKEKRREEKKMASFEKEKGKRSRDDESERDMYAYGDVARATDQKTQAERMVRAALAIEKPRGRAFSSSTPDSHDSTATDTESEQTHQQQQHNGSDEDVSKYMSAQASVDAIAPSDAESDALKAFKDLSLQIVSVKEAAKKARAELEASAKQARAELLEAMLEMDVPIAEVPRAIVDAQAPLLSARGLGAMRHYVRVKTTTKPNKAITSDVIEQVLVAVTESNIEACVAKALQARKKEEAVSDDAEDVDVDVDVDTRTAHKKKRKSLSGKARASAEKEKEKEKGPASIGEAFVEYVVGEVLERIRGEQVFSAELTDTVTRGIRPFSIVVAARPVILLAITLHDLQQQCVQIGDTHKEELRRLVEQLGVVSPIVSSFLERSGHETVDFAAGADPRDPGRGVYISRGQQREVARPVGIRAFKTIVTTALTERFGDFRAIHDIKTLLRAKESLLQAMKQQIAAMPPVVRVVPPKLRHNPGRAEVMPNPTVAAAEEDDEEEEEEDD